MFELRINQFTGEYEFRLFDELIHLLPNPLPGSEENFTPALGRARRRRRQAFINKIDFGSIIQASDYDGDKVVLEDDFFIKIRDDVPEADIDLKDHKEVIHDETPGDDGDHDKSFGSLPGSAQAAFTALHDRTTGNDPDVPPVSGAIGYAHNSNAIVTTNDTEEGADAPPAEETLSLEINGVNGLDSGLDTTEGVSIFLYKEGDLIVGRVGGAAGLAAFAIHIDQDGEISVAQYLSIRHDDINDHDENDDDGTNSQDDGPVNENPNPSSRTLDGKINAVFTITDSDGDTDSDSVNVGKRIIFEDDGPRIKNADHSGVHVIHDETPGIDLPDDDVADLSALFAGVLAPLGDDPHVPPPVGPIGYAQSDGSLVDFDVEYGADGGAAQNPLKYELVLKDGATEKDSGLNTTEGRNIHLFKEGNYIVGRYEVGGDNNPEGDDPAAFAIHIDPTTGVVSVVQYVSVFHPDENDPDDTVDINDDVLYVQVTATDGDGDFDSEKIDVGTKIEFEDDGPKLTGTPTAVFVDEDDIPGQGNSDVQTGDDLGDPRGVRGQRHDSV